VNLLQYGTYPAIYDATYLRIKQCGCLYSPSKINWGSRIGLECKREVELGQELPAFDPEHCGTICNNQHGFDTILLCPPGFEGSCAKGCNPKAVFGSFVERVDFWEGMVHRFLLDGTDYFTIQPKYLSMCGCQSKARRILYGSKVGFDCVQKQGAEMNSECTAVANCKDERNRQLVTFCPSGFSPSCAGCVKEISGTDSMSKLNWMVGVTSDIVQLSLTDLRWQPKLKQILGCGCKGDIVEVTYGARIGLICKIHSEKLITNDCGSNVLCVNNLKEDILHICPTGFIPDCKLGCATPIQQQKVEL